MFYRTVLIWNISRTQSSKEKLSNSADDDRSAQSVSLLFKFIKRLASVRASVSIELSNMRRKFKFPFNGKHNDRWIQNKFVLIYLGLEVLFQFKFIAKDINCHWRLSLTSSMPCYWKMSHYWFNIWIPTQLAALASTFDIEERVLINSMQRIFIHELFRSSQQRSLVC